MLNSKHDLASLIDQYRQTLRIAIDDVFDSGAAEAILGCLENDLPWRFTYREDNRQKIVDHDTFAAWTPESRAALNARIAETARTEFQHAYMMYPMIEEYLRGKTPTLFLNRVVEFLNSPDMLQFVRRVTGIDEIVRASPQATLFVPGHFLTQHDDQDETAGRRVAFVLSFAKGWRPDWGGVLQFLNSRGDVIEGILPRFNQLTMFTVPQTHLVSCVSPFAPIGRFSISGWFMNANGVPAQTRAKYGI